MDTATKQIRFSNDIDASIAIMHEAGTWLHTTGKNKSVWWDPMNMNKDFLLKHIHENEFFVLFVDNIPAGSIILQFDQRNQDWSSVDKGKNVAALYIHWLCVKREFASQHIPDLLIDYAQQYTVAHHIHHLRLDTNANEKNLTSLYERLGFTSMGTAQEGESTKVFYQKEIPDQVSK